MRIRQGLATGAVLGAVLLCGCGPNSGNGDSSATNGVNPSPPVSPFCSDTSQPNGVDCEAIVTRPPAATPATSPSAHRAAPCRKAHHRHERHHHEHHRCRHT
jgi:hypothetical protein